MNERQGMQGVVVVFLAVHGSGIDFGWRNSIGMGSDFKCSVRELVSERAISSGSQFTHLSPWKS